MRKVAPESMDLHAKFPGLNTADYVESAAQRTRGVSRDKNTLPVQDPEARVQNYLDRIQAIFSHPDPEIRERLIKKFKQDLHKRHIIKPNLKQTEKEVGVQTESLDQWVDYLGKEEFSDWVKFWIMRGVLRMGRYNKETKKFKERDGKTQAPFAELNQKAVNLIAQIMQEKYQGKEPGLPQDLESVEKDNLKNALEKEKFADIYGQLFDKMKPIPEELLKITTGSWRHFSGQGDVRSLMDSVKDWGTNWCLRLETSANGYLTINRYNLEVFYSNDIDGVSKVPRAVIVKGYGAILEVCGIEGVGELVEKNIIPIVRERILQLPQNEQWLKACDDTERLFELKEKVALGKDFSLDDLVFLYEANIEINNLGRKANPLIARLKEGRDMKADLSKILEVKPEQIAVNEEEITDDTKVYVGPFSSGIFKKLPKVEHLFATSPKWRRVPVYRARVKELASLERTTNELKESGYEVSDDASNLLQKTELQKKDQRILTACFKFAELVPKEILEKRSVQRTDFSLFEELGLELCPSYVGSSLRMVVNKQPKDSIFYLGMQPVVVYERGRDRHGILTLQNIDGELVLHASILDKNTEWKSYDEIILAIPSEGEK